MPEPITTAALITAGSSLLKSSLNWWQTRDLRKLQQDLLNEQVQYKDDLARRSRGKFTDSELQMIRMGAAPQLNALSGSVAARLGSGSPAGAQIVAGAQQAPVNAAMMRAQGEYGAALSGLSAQAAQMIGGMGSDRGFAEDVGGLIAAFQDDRAHGDGSDPVAEMALDSLIGMDYSPGALFQRSSRGQGYQNLKPPALGGTGEGKRFIWQ